MATPHSQIKILAIFALSACGFAQAQVQGAVEPLVVTDHSGSCAPQETTIIVQRDDRIRGSAIRSQFLLDGKELGEIKRGQTIQYCAGTGEHIVGVASSFFGGMGAQKRELAVDFKADKKYAFRIFILHAQGAIIERTAL